MEITVFITTLIALALLLGGIGLVLHRLKHVESRMHTPMLPDLDLLESLEHLECGAAYLQRGGRAIIWNRNFRTLTGMEEEDLRSGVWPDEKSEAGRALLALRTEEHRQPRHFVGTQGKLLTASSRWISNGMRLLLRAANVEERQSSELLRRANLERRLLLEYICRNFRFSVRSLLISFALLRKHLHKSGGCISLSHLGARYLASVEHFIHLFASEFDDLHSCKELMYDRIPLQSSEADLPGLLEEVVLFADLEARKRGLEVALLVKPSVPSRAVLDGSKLQYMIWRLCERAFRTTREGGIFVEADSIEEQLRLRICDTGRGIASELDDAASMESGVRDAGTIAPESDVRFSLISQLSKLMGGSFSLESRHNGGTMAEIRIPVRSAGASRARALLTSGVGQEKKIRVLILDDNPVHRMCGTETCRSCGWFAEAVSGARQGIQAMTDAENRKQPFSAIVVALRMPKLSGADFQRLFRIESTCVDTRLILTCDPRQIGKARSLQGFDAILVKPFLSSHLISAIQGAISSVSLPVQTRISSWKSPPFLTFSSIVQPLRILLALAENDEQSTLTIEILRGMDCDVCVVRNGRAALKAALRETFDLILMDVYLPGKNAPEVARSIRWATNANAKVPIWAFVSDFAPEERAQCLDAGVDDFLIKPIHVDALLRALAWWGRSDSAFFTKSLRDS